MANIIEKMHEIDNLNGMKGCSIAQLRAAEKELGLKFPDEYIDYVREYGCIDFGSIEWTGLNINGRLNTVVATKEEKEVNSAFPEGCFVLEDLNIDAKKIIVNESGQVFLIQYDKRKPICNSISEYLDICIERDKG